MSDDDETAERLKEVMERLRRRHEADVLSAAEESLSHTSTSDCPPPLSWHPFYRGKTHLLDWLNGTSDLPKWDIMIPIQTRPLFASLTDEPSPIAEPAFKTMRMSKQRAWGSAPWVGRPFHYEWYIGTDEVGRSIAGESRIVYDEWYAGMPGEFWPLAHA